MFRTLMMPVLLASVILMGCSDDSPVAGSTHLPLAGFTVSPADGELNVTLPQKPDPGIMLGKGSEGG